MRKGIVLAALCTLGALAFSTTALAYDDLYSDDTAVVKAANGLSGSIGLPFMTASKGLDGDGDSYDLRDFRGSKESVTLLSLPVRIDYGVTDKLTVFGVVPVFNKWDFGDNGESGFGDIWVGAKYAVMPALTLRGALDLPTGDDDKNLGYAGGFGFDVAAMSSYQMEQIGLNGQVGIRYNVEDGDTKYAPGVGIYLDAEGVYSFSQALDGKVGIEFMSFGEGETDGVSQDDAANFLDLKVGGAYKLSEKANLGVNLYYTLAGKEIYKDMTVMVKLGYSVR